MRPSRRDELAERRDKLRKEVKDEMDRFDEEDRLLIAQFQRLDSEAGSTRRQLLLLSGDISRQEAQLANERDPAIRAVLLGESTRWDFLAMRYNRVLRSQAAASDHAAHLVLPHQRSRPYALPGGTL